MTKLISLTDDAYKSLARAKLSDESFSKVVKRLTSKTKGSLLDFAGKWPGGSNEAKSVFDKILKERHTYTKMRQFKL